MMALLKPLADNLWVADYPLKFYGLPIDSRMAVIRLQNGEVVVISPIGVTPQLQTELAAIGKISTIVAPNLYHHLFAKDFAAAYPEAKLLAVQGMQEKRPDLVVDRYMDETEGEFGPDLRYRLFDAFRVWEPRGNMLFNEYLFLHGPSRTLIITDAAFHFGPESHWVIQGLAKLLGIYQKLQPSLLERLALRDRAGALATIQTVLGWDFDRVIMAHGSIVETDGKAKLKAGYEWYLQRSLG